MLPEQQLKTVVAADAGQYFESEARDWLHAASHFLEASEDSRAARQATLEVWQFINQGRAGQLTRVLDRFAPDRLDRMEWTAIGIGRGEVRQFLHDTEEARSSYQSVLDALPEADSSHAVRELRARALLDLGDLHVHREDWQAAEAALEEAEKIVEELDTPYPLPEAYFLRSHVYRETGRIQEAHELAQRAVDLAHELDLALEEGKA